MMLHGIADIRDGTESEAARDQPLDAGVTPVTKLLLA
jgi:hypothetical protein